MLGCARGESGASQTRCDGQRRAHPAPSLRRGRTRPGRAASLTPVASLSFLNFLSVIQWFIQRFESCCSAGLSTRSSAEKAEKGPHRRRRRTHAPAARCVRGSSPALAWRPKSATAGQESRGRPYALARASPADLAVRLREATVYTAALLYVASCEPAMATAQVVSPAGLTHAQKEKCGRRSNRPAWFSACWASRQHSHTLLCV